MIEKAALAAVVEPGAADGTALEQAMGVGRDRGLVRAGAGGCRARGTGIVGGEIGRPGPGEGEDRIGAAGTVKGGRGESGLGCGGIARGAGAQGDEEEALGLGIDAATWGRSSGDVHRGA